MGQPFGLQLSLHLHIVLKLLCSVVSLSLSVSGLLLHDHFSTWQSIERQRIPPQLQEAACEFVRRTCSSILRQVCV